jgi:hypothetical protein
MPVTRADAVAHLGSECLLTIPAKLACSAPVAKWYTLQT